MFRTARPDSGREAGFTLIEALAALSVMGVGLAAIGALAHSNLRSTLHTERHLADVETARKILVGLPRRDALLDGRLDGALDSHVWSIEAAPVPVQSSGAAWTPQNIALSVRSRAGTLIQIDMIRLRRGLAK